MESKKRSLIKSVSYRVFGSFVTFLISFFFTGKADFSAMIAVSDLILKTLLFYVHERIWQRIKVF
jgi:uncharacterized membrane protein